MAFPLKNQTLKGFIKMGPELAIAPPPPPPGGAVMWLRDNGSGKTQLVILFDTGDPVEVAVEV